ncbi:uncharacterized protein FYW61_020440 [Anableps anableps]
MLTLRITGLILMLGVTVGIIRTRGSKKPQKDINVPDAVDDDTEPVEEKLISITELEMMLFYLVTVGHVPHALLLHGFTTEIQTQVMYLWLKVEKLIRVHVELPG